MAKLETGHYNIVNLAQESGSIGRFPIEDKSLLPKRIVVIPQSIKPSRWIVEALPNGRYILKNGGAPTAETDNLVFAFLRDEKKEEWKITYRENHDAYTIEKGSGESGWVIPDVKPETQVAVHPLISTKSIPPQFPHTELWKIMPLLDD
ncbi:hypothetical protein BV22DRAFT_531734 [Leucogyrophana mollusca]|uniref:Uncharacterized protein n=1 Tax=Leucogyrophana mollusca TaxID=85980 RepID=A0ACB8BH23_9AGAM|nr:hypothetical protein BV22DRAFT_531734 [Leucogyrophana mollusca]